jgi:hypothetical protein
MSGKNVHSQVKKNLDRLSWGFPLCLFLLCHLSLSNHISVCITDLASWNLNIKTDNSPWFFVLSLDSLVI